MPAGSSGDLTQPVDTEFLTMAMNETAVPAFEMDDDQTARVVKLLADRIGPVAPVLVKRGLKKADSLADLVSKLAKTIPDETERRSFTDALVNPS